MLCSVSPLYCRGFHQTLLKTVLLIYLVSLGRVLCLGEDVEDESPTFEYILIMFNIRRHKISVQVSINEQDIKFRFKFPETNTGYGDKGGVIMFIFSH